MELGRYQVNAWLDTGPAHQLFRTIGGDLVYRFLPTLPGPDRLTLRQPLERLLDLSQSEMTVTPVPLERSFDPDEWLAVFEDPIGRRAVDMQGELRPGQVLWLVREVARGLLSFHSAGLFHGAITASRLVVDASGRVTLMDPGTALLAEQLHRGELRPPKRGFGDLYHEPSALPPELLRGGSLSPASDIFSLAAVSFRLLTGRTAHRAGRTLEVYGRLRRGERSKFGDLATPLPTRLALLLDAALGPEPRDRPRADELVEAIEAGTDATLMPPTVVAERAAARWSATLPEREPEAAPSRIDSAQERRRQELIRRASLQLEHSRVQRSGGSGGTSRTRMGLMVTLVVVLGLALIWPLIAKRTPLPGGRDTPVIDRRTPEERAADRALAGEEAVEEDEPAADPRPAPKTTRVVIGSDRRIRAPKVRRRTPERESRQERHGAQAPSAPEAPASTGAGKDTR